MECKIVIFFAPSGMLAPSRDRRGEEESAMKMGVPHLVEGGRYMAEY